MASAKKFILFATFIVLALSSNIVPIRGFDNAPTLQDRRISTSSPHGSSSDSCVGQCALEFIEEMRAEFGAESDGSPSGVLNLNFDDFFFAFSNVTFFEKFCTIYHKFNFCYMKCPHGYMQELLQRSSEIVDHYCVYNFKAIKDSFGCLGKVDKQMAKACLKVCTPTHDAVTSLMHNFRQVALNGDTTQAEHYLGQSCEYAICGLHCEVPMIAHECGFETADLVINLTKKSFETMQKMTLDTGIISKWPATCADIKTYLLPKAPKSPPTSAGANLTMGVVIAQSPILKDSVVSESKMNDDKNLQKRSNNTQKGASSNANRLPASFSWLLIFSGFVLLNNFIFKKNFPSL